MFPEESSKYDFQSGGKYYQGNGYENFISGNYWDPVNVPRQRAAKLGEGTAARAGVWQAAYWKAAIANHYDCTDITDVGVYTIGLGGNYKVLNPKGALSANDYNTWANSIGVSRWNQRFDSNGNGVWFPRGFAMKYRTAVNYHWNVIPNEGDAGYEEYQKKFGKYGVTNSQLSIDYPSERGVYSENNPAGLLSIFDSIYSNILILARKQLIAPVSGENQAGVSDSVTYFDPVGTYMEIKKGTINAGDIENADMAMLLFGNMHEITKTGVYDFNFNYKYKLAHSGAGEYYEGYPNEYKVLQNGWYSSDDPLTAEYLGDSNDYSWKDGYFRYINYETAVEYVPTLAELTDTNNDGTVNGLDASDKQKNTVYEIFRFSDVEHRDQWLINPSYAWNNLIFTGSDDVASGQTPDYNKDFVMNNALQNEYNNLINSGQSVPNGIYRLSDIRIWTEYTGDYVDNNESDLYQGLAYDDALYLNIPSNALPLEVAEVTIDPYGVKSYVTNLGDDHVQEGDGGVAYYRQSTPFRLFYSIGLQDAILTDDRSGIDLTKVSHTYLNSHKNEDGSVYFLSNFFTGNLVEGNDDAVKGDPFIAFSPDIENKFYVFQKYRILYERAYQWDANSKVFNLVTGDKITTLEGLELRGKFDSVEEAYADTTKNEYKNGDVVFINNDAATGGRSVKFVIVRSYNDLTGGDYGNISTANMLCWYNLETKETAAYNRGQKPQYGGNWVLSTNIGGLRLNALFPRYKEDQPNKNITGTSTAFYYPTISTNSSANQGIFVNVYLGNNDRMTVDDTLLLVTKLVADETGFDTTQEKEFTYQVYVEDFTGVHGAIKVLWEDKAQVWRRRIATIDAVTNNDNYLLLSNANTIAVVDKDGNLVSEADQIAGETYYYVRFDDFSENSGQHVAHVYSSAEINEEAAGNRYAFNRDDGYVVQFRANRVALVPINGNEELYIDNFVIAEMLLSDDGGQLSNIDLTSNFNIHSEYMTVDIYFGVEDKDIEADDEADFKAPSKIYDTDYSFLDDRRFDDGQPAAQHVHANTAEFTLRSGEGLLFNGIASGGNYRVTEILDKNEYRDGWSLWKKNIIRNKDTTSKPLPPNEISTINVAVRHVQSDSFINYNFKGEPTDVWSAYNGGTLWGKSGDNFVNPANNRELLEKTVHFVDNDDQHTYSVFGNTAAQEEAVQYINMLDYAPLTICKKVVGEAPDNAKYTFGIEIKDANGKPLSGIYHAYIHATDHKCEPEKEHKHGAKCTDLILKNGSGKVELKDSQSYVIQGLPQGAKYKITEVITPDDSGCATTITVNGSEDKLAIDNVKRTVSGNLNFADPKTEKIMAVDVVYKNFFYDLSELPNLGGTGTTIFYIIGGMMLVGAVLCLYISRKKRVFHN